MYKISSKVPGVMLAVALLANVASADLVTVSSFDSAYTANGRWYQDGTQNGGSATISTFSDPSFPPGSAQLMTGSTNDQDRAQVSVSNDYGQVSTSLSGIGLSYDYFNSPGNVNLATAPSLKLTFASTSGSVTLIYEQYWNNPGYANPTANVWTPVSIDYTHGLFWSNGGFGSTSSHGGDPSSIHTLADWQTILNGSSAGAFDNAHLVTVSMGVGTYNRGQNDYFDGVHIASGSINNTYNFSPTPEPSTLISGGVGALFLLGYAWRRRRHSGSDGQSESSV